MEKLWRLLRVGGSCRQQGLKAVKLKTNDPRGPNKNRFRGAWQEKKAQARMSLLHYYVFPWLLVTLETPGAVSTVFL